MSQSSTSPIDPFEFSTSQDSSSRSGNLEAVPIPSKLARLRDQLATDGGSESTDLALDLVLNEIVQQVRITTRATGAAVALLRGDEMVCRATTGGNAPDMGVRLDTKTGLSGACVETRLTQLCADTELDDRVDVAACRALGVRSILVLPLLDEARLIGVFEVFSPLPSAFGDRDIQTLQAFVRQILQAVGEARLLSSAPIKPSSEAETQAYSYEPELPAIAPPTEVVQGESGPPPQPRRDWLTPFLTVLVIALSILLGTLLGLHVSRPKQPRAARRTPGASPTAAASTTNAALEFSGSNAPPLDSEAPTNTQAPSAAAPVNRDKSGPPPRGNLTVYRDERVVYQDGQHIEPALAPAPASSAPQPATPQSSLLPALPDLPTHTAMALLPKQIDPEYPAGFAASSVQTPVQVRIAVDSTGAVQYARIVSGPNELAAPALDAVKKWHFNPYSVKGTAVPFQTLVTVHFATR
jgi:TonB family protein